LPRRRPTLAQMAEILGGTRLTAPQHAPRLARGQRSERTFRAGTTIAQGFGIRAGTVSRLAIQIQLNDQFMETQATSAQSLPRPAASSGRAEVVAWSQEQSSDHAKGVRTDAGSATSRATARMSVVSAGGAESAVWVEESGPAPGKSLGAGPQRIGTRKATFTAQQCSALPVFGNASRGVYGGNARTRPRGGVGSHKSSPVAASVAPTH
jgi:hypothetical protein